MYFLSGSGLSFDTVPRFYFFFFSFQLFFFLDLVQTIYNIFSRLMQCGRRYPHRHQLENFKFMGRWIFQIDGVFTPTSVSSMFRLLQYMWTSFTHSIRAVFCLGNLHQKKTTCNEAQLHWSRSNIKHSAKSHLTILTFNLPAERNVRHLLGELPNENIKLSITGNWSVAWIELEHEFSFHSILTIIGISGAK